MTAHAFGLALSGEVGVPGTAGEPPPGLPEVVLERAARRDLLAAWPQDARHVSRMPGIVIEASPRDDVLLRATGYGVARISGDGRRIACAPPARGGQTRFGRFAAAQVLPFAALLHGREVLHAAVVSAGGGAVLLAGASMSGKTTVSAAWRARGGGFVADDVAAITLDGGRPVVHPGPGMASDRDEHGWHPVARVPAPVAVRAVVLLRRDPPARRIRVATPDGPVAPLLLGATFNAAWRRRDRALHQLDVCEALARQAQVVEVAVPEGMAPQRTVAALERALA